MIKTRKAKEETEREEETERTRSTKRGRGGIDSPKREAKSRRAIEGYLTVIRKRCQKCGHKKALTTINQTKCSKCGNKVKK